MGANGSGLQSKSVTLTVNGTAYSLQTNITGYVSLHLSLQPGGTGAAGTYQITAMFNGTNPRTASLNSSDPYGHQYAACTTTQCDLGRATNSSTLSALLQSTDAITAAQNMKEMHEKQTTRLLGKFYLSCVSTE